MNLLQLKKSVDSTIEHLPKHQNPEDIKVLISLSDSSIGPRASTLVKYACMGFDWESGQFRMEPEIELVSKGNSLNDIKEIKCRIYQGKNYYVCAKCENKVSKNDRYCKHCGQRMRK